MGASGCAAVGVVTEGVDVEATLGVRVVARDVKGDGGGVGLGGLLESDGSGNLGVTSEDSDWRHRPWSARTQLSIDKATAARTQQESSQESIPRGVVPSSYKDEDPTGWCGLLPIKVDLESDHPRENRRKCAHSNGNSAPPMQERKHKRRSGVFKLTGFDHFD